MNYQIARQYFESNLVQIVKSQERRLGITHFGMPQIKFAVNPGYEDFGIIDFFHFMFAASGSYDAERDVIYLNPVRISSPVNNTWKDISDLLFIGYSKSVVCVAEHELGHFYADQVSEAIGRGNFPILARSKAGTFRYVEAHQQVVNEGIAENFVEDDCRTSQNEFFGFPNDLRTLNPRDSAYFYGYHLVRPVFRKFGVGEGIKILLQNPLSKDELPDLSAYQNRIISMTR